MPTESLPISQALPGTMLRPPQRVVVLTLLLGLNSILACLGSILWTHIPYWPAFMVSAAACAFLGKWGLLVGVLSPFTSYLLGIGGSPSFWYVPVDVLQACLVLWAIRASKVNVTLPAVSDVFIYCLAVVIAPSLLGGTLAWCVQRLEGSSTTALSYHLTWWTVENLLPVIFPGIWLHHTLGELGAPAIFKRQRRSRPWIVNAIYFSAPWVLSLLLIGILVTAMVTEEVRPGLLDVKISLWERVHAHAGHSIPLRLLVLTVSISMLCSIIIAFKFGRRSWVLEQEIARRLPFRLEGDMPSGSHVVTVMFTDIRGFTATSSRFPPDELVAWLNAYFDRMCRTCARHNGYVDKFIGDGLMIVFGLGSPDHGSGDAIRCAVAMLEDLKLVNETAAGRGYPAIQIGIGIHTGTVIAGEVGASERLQFTVIGSTVNIAARLESKCKDLPSDALPIVISDDTMRDAGLLLDEPALEKMNSLVADDLKGVPPLKVWTTIDGKELLAGLSRCTQRRQHHRALATL